MDISYSFFGHHPTTIVLTMDSSLGINISGPLKLPLTSDLP
jgi:hypothetical protein